MKEINEQNKPKRIVSTVFLIIFFAIVFFLCWLTVELLVGIKNFDPDASGTFEDLSGEEALVVAPFLGIVMLAPYILTFICSVLIIFNSVICLGFSIRNTRVENKTVKIINIVLSCLFAAAVALGITAIILMRYL